MRLRQRNNTAPVGKLDLTGLPMPDAPAPIVDRDVVAQALDTISAGERARWELQEALDAASAAVEHADAALADAAATRDNSSDVDAVMAAKDSAGNLEVVGRVARKNEAVLHSRLVALDNRQAELQRALAAVRLADAARSAVVTAAGLSEALRGPLSAADGAVEDSRRHGGRLTVPAPVEELRHALDSEVLADHRADAELDLEGCRRQLAGLLDVAAMETHGLAVTDG